MVQLKDALNQGTELLEHERIPSPRLTAEVLLMHAARCDRAYLFAHPDRELTQCEWVHYGRYLNERLGGKPTQYITGHQEFWGMDFLVNPSVLIPRPETELVVEAAAELAREHFPAGAPLNVADVGTGSGCIAVALAKELPHAALYALDRSRAALDTARANAERNGTASQITFLESDLLDPCGAERLPDLHMVVSNPPYVGERDREHVAREVREFEPADAVFSGECGGEVYARLIPQAARAMPHGGFLVMELGYDSEPVVRGLLEKPVWNEVHWFPDLAGILRVVTARRGADRS